MTATAASAPAVGTDRTVVLPHVSWETYQRLLADDEGRRVPRLTYDRGVLEVVSPSFGHERDGETLALLVEIVAAVCVIEVLGVGSMTYQRQDLQRGFEPDASFYIQHAGHLRGRRRIDPAVDPPPDLVIEIDASRSSLDKLALYAAAGVSEVWRHNEGHMVIHVLDHGTYREAAVSRALPVLTSDVLTRFLAESRSTPRPEWFRVVSDWARAQCAGSGPTA